MDLIQPRYNFPFKPPMGSVVDTAHPLVKDLAGCWLLNEGAGNVVRDISGHGLNGDISGAAWSITTEGHGLTFDRTDDYVLVGDKPALANATQISIAAWVRLPTGSGASDWYQTVISKYNDPSWAGVAWSLRYGVDVANYVNFFFEVPETGDYKLVSTDWINSSLYYNKWVFVVGIYDGSYVRLYVNAEEKATPVAKTAAVQESPGVPIYMGRAADKSGGTQPMGGTLGTCLLYRRSLTPSEIRSLYRDPYQMLRRPRIELWPAGISGEESPTYTASGGGTAIKATASASATFTVPTYTGSGSPTASKAATSASATFTAPVYTATGGAAASKATAAAAAVYTVPIYSATGGGSSTKATASASATYAVPVYAADGSAIVSKPTASASATFAVPVYSGSGDGTAPKATASASAIYGVAIYSASGGGTSPQPTASAAATYAAPVYAAAGSVVVSKPTASASATFAVPVYSGSGGGMAAKATASASALYGVAIYSGFGGGTVSKPTASAAATYTVPEYAAIGSAIVSTPAGSASATFAVPVYSGLGGGIVSKPTASAAALYGLIYSAVGGGVVPNPSASADATFLASSIAAGAIAFTILKRRQ